MQLKLLIKFVARCPILLIPDEEHAVLEDLGEALMVLELRWTDRLIFIHLEKPVLLNAFEVLDLGGYFLAILRCFQHKLLLALGAQNVECILPN
jgi:hypothetical protein